MRVLLAAVPLITTAWFFNLQLDGGAAVRYGPYLTEATCEAVRARLADRVSSKTAPSPCFKVIVQENDQIAE
ncbi:MAG: hypothetical protein DME06_07380 [Candidatus Rokuibacteriota bacterium]|nr:MAG: hypothetical protein DME06_07380 [Candidatus Rokubacteria bacterium]